MKPEHIVSRRLYNLFLLPEKKEFIQLTDLRKEYRQDLKNFITGETLGVREGKPVIGKNLYKKWLLKIKSKGFDYDVNLI